MALRWDGDHERRHAADAGRLASQHPPPSATRPVPPEQPQPSSSSSAVTGSVSFIELYHQHFGYVWKSARRLGVSPAEVDDVVQETFLTVHRLLDSYNARGFERSWLFAVLFRVVQRHHRACRRRSAMTEERDVDAMPGSVERGPERAAEANETVRLLESILDSLDPEKRAALVLSDIEGRTAAEIAEILGMNPNTVASRIRAAREYVEAAMTRHQARDGWRYK